MKKLFAMFIMALFLISFILILIEYGIILAISFLLFLNLVAATWYYSTHRDLLEDYPVEKEIKITGDKIMCVQFSRYENLFGTSIEIIVSTLGILLSIPFAVTLPISHYERLAGEPIGSRWYIGVILILITFVLMFALKMFRGKSFKVALYTNSFIIIWIFINSVFLNSMWQYGVVLHPGYFESYKIFFTSELVVSILLGLVATSSFAIIPNPRGKITMEKL